MTTKIVVSRKWNAPEIRVFVENSGIGAEIDIDKYFESLIHQISNVPFIMTKSGLLKKITEAHNNIITELKNSTKYIA